MELVLTLPILLVLLLGIFEFTCLFYAHSNLVQASRNGARQASMAGATHDQVVHQVKTSLGGAMGSTTEVYTTLPVNSGETVTVYLETPMHVAAPNLLWPIGYDLRGQTLKVQTSMLRE